MRGINIPIFLLAIVLSTFLWFVRFGKELMTPATVPVKLSVGNAVGLPANLAVDGDIPGFNLQLLGSAEQIAKAEAAPDLNTMITIDLTSAKAGTRAYPLQFNPSLSRLVQAPRSLPVTIEEIVSKPVSVKVEFKGKLKDPSLRVDSYRKSDDTATITAPKHIADSITGVRAVLDLNQINPTNPDPQDLLLVPFGDNKVTYDAKIDPVRIRVTPIVIPAGIQKSVVISPDIVGSPAMGYIPLGAKLNPKEIQLSGPSSTLNNIVFVKTAPIDVTNLTGTKWFLVNLMLPVGTTSPTRKVHVRYDIAEDPAVRKSQTKPTPRILPSFQDGSVP